MRKEWKDKTVLVIAIFYLLFLMGCNMKDMGPEGEKTARMITHADSIVNIEEVTEETTIKQEEKEIVEGELREEEPREEIGNTSVNLPSMDYALFLDTKIEFGASLSFHEYGIFGDFTKIADEGKQLYFSLCEKLTGTKLCLTTPKEWYFNRDEHIQNLSPDLEWIVARQYSSEYTLTECYHDKVYHKGLLYTEDDGDVVISHLRYLFTEQENGTFHVLQEEKMNFRVSMVDELWGWNVTDFVSSIDDTGKLLAVSERETNDIHIFSLEDHSRLFHFTMEGLDGDYPVEISQIEGTKEGGWVVFSNGGSTWRMDFPQGNMEKIGEFMFGMTYSPDGRYRAYCTGSELLLEQCRMIQGEKTEKIVELFECWNDIPTGWYIEDLDTGEQTYIPVDTGGERLYGGRCVWLEKDKLVELLEDMG